jgi:hypothetical protein
MKCGGSKKIAFVDLEYGHIHGTYKQISMPIEAGILFYDATTNSVDYSGRKFTYDIDIECWKSRIDQYGNRIGTTASVANLKRREYNRRLDKEYRLSDEQKKNAYKIARSAHRSLKSYMNESLELQSVDKLIFFGDRMEKNAFKRAKINTRNYEWIDLQTEIMNEYNIENKFSLDKLSFAIKFHSNEKHIKSFNFKYKVPDKYKYQIKPHKALGDSARIFLAYKEFNHDRNKFKKIIGDYLKLCNLNLEQRSLKNT